METVAKRRDWLTELRIAGEAGDVAAFKAVALEAPERLRGEICALAGECFEDGERWASSFLHAIQPSVADSRKRLDDLGKRLAVQGERIVAELKAKVAAKPAEPITKPAAPTARAFEEARLRRAKAAAPPVEKVVELVRAKPEPEPVPEAATPVAVPRCLFGAELDRSGDMGEVRVSVNAPFENAREWTRRRAFRAGQLATFYDGGGFWQWNGCCYVPVDEALVIRPSVYEFLTEGMVQTINRGGELQLVRFSPKPEDVNKLIDGLKAGLGLGLTPGYWVDTGEPAGNIINFANGFVDVTTGRLLPATPRLWVKGALDFAYDPEARCPRWEQFLEEVFPGDREAQDCSEEQIGYGMTDDTSLEKAALWIGEPRSGKSTLAHIQKKLVGSASWASLSLNSWMRGENSRENMIGKRLLIFADVRLKPGKWWGQNYDPGGLDHQSAELLLNIIGRDPVSVGQKWKSAWQGYTALKILMTSNDPPNLQDTAGNLPGKFIKVWFGQSFWGREDVGLRSKLEEELPGIANRCLAAYRRLRSRGHFVQPASGLNVKRKVDAKTNPMAAFAQDRLVVDPSASIKIAVLGLQFEDWCAVNGRRDYLLSVPKNQIKKNLARVEGFEFLAEATSHRPRSVDDQRVYYGFRLRTKKDGENEE
jgi:putative DNA primase/helicase